MPSFRILSVVALLAAGLAARAAGDILVTNGGASYSVEAFHDGANGDVQPSPVIAGNSTDLNLPDGLDVDPVHGEIYVPSDFGDRIDVFPIGATGDITPLRSIVGPHTGLHEPAAVFVDLVHDEIVVGNFNSSSTNNGVGSVTVYPRAAGGDVAPLRTIVGPAAKLSYVSGLAADPATGEIFVTSQGNPGGVLVFARTANGDVAPKRILSGSSTGLVNPYGVTVDAARGELWVSDRTGAVSAFAETAGGNVAPLRRIAGSATLLGTGETLGVKVLNDHEIVVASPGNGGNDYSDDSLLVFARTANGNVAPIRRINGPHTGISGPVGVAVYHRPLIVEGGRFAIEAAWETASDAGGGTPTVLGGDTGDFWFFTSTNIEAVAKVLDGCGTNQRFWFFAGGLTNVYTSLQVTDLATGKVRRYANPQGTAFQPIQDTSAFATCGAAATAPSAVEPVATPELPRSVAPSCSGLCLDNGRFQVSASFQTPQGQSGAAHTVALTTDTGYLWFFSAANVEAVVKVLDGCGVNGKYWVFAGGLTDVHVDLTVLDTAHGTSVVYHNPQGTAFRPIQDTAAFATCP